MKKIIFFTFLLMSIYAMHCKDPCTETYCLNGGACIDGDCKCPEGYYGDHCELTFSGAGCNGGCLNGGTCINDTCDCPPGFSGLNCEIEDVTVSPPSVFFDISYNKIIADQTNVEFEGKSTSPLSSYYWDFGQNEGSSNSSSPTYQFNYEGNKQITFTGTNSAGSDSESKVIKVHAMNPDCHNYSLGTTHSKGSIGLVRNNNMLVTKWLRFQNNYGGKVFVDLYHPDEWLNGKYTNFANVHWEVNSNLPNWVNLNYNGSKIVIGNDWGIRVRFSNGVTSCIRNIHAFASAEGNYFYVKASEVFEGG